jgi:hypothetical protein
LARGFRAGIFIVALAVPAWSNAADVLTLHDDAGLPMARSDFVEDGCLFALI